MNNELLVKSIRELCKKNNIAISQLEGDLNFGSGLISRWTKNSPSIDKIVDIANYFHVSLDEVVGYNCIAVTNDDFLKVLIEQTRNHVIEWHSKKEMGLESIYTYYLVGSGSNSQYDNEAFNDVTYYTRFMEGYITIYAVYENSKVMEPVELFLLIQPDNDSEVVKQNYEYRDMLPLYLSILSVLGDEAPDEIRVKYLKELFINNFKKINEIKTELDTNKSAKKRTIKLDLEKVKESISNDQNSPKNYRRSSNTSKEI